MPKPKIDRTLTVGKILGNLNTNLPGMNINGNYMVPRTDEERKLLHASAVELRRRRRAKHVEDFNNRSEVIKIRDVTHPEEEEDRYEGYKKPSVIGMSGYDPLLGMWPEAVATFGGAGTLFKTGLWNLAKRVPTSQLGNYGRLYFVENAFKNAYIKEVPKVISQNMSLAYQPVRLNETGLTSLKFFERKPSRISDAERVGVPKGERDVWDPQVMLNAKEFANKYGYEVPLTIEEAKNMYRQHNRFFRSVDTEKYEPRGDSFYEYSPNYKPGMSEEETIYGLYPEFKGLSPELLRFTLASKGYPVFDRSYILSDIGKGPLDDFVFVSPSLNENVVYANSMGDDFSNTVLLLRPFSFGKPSEWHINADWRPSKKVVGRLHNKGEVSEGNSYFNHEAKISTKHLIPVKIAEKGDLGTFLGDYLEKQKYKGSLPYEINIPINKQGGKMNTLLFLKSGNKIHIKKKNRGKFTEYCGGSVTDECIRRAKSSGNPTLVKRATFAANARKWKHLTGGLIRKAQQGTNTQSFFDKVINSIFGDKGDRKRFMSDLRHLGILPENSNPYVQLGIVAPGITPTTSSGMSRVALMEKKAPNLFKFLSEGINLNKKGRLRDMFFKGSRDRESLKKFFETGDVKHLENLENWAKRNSNYFVDYNPSEIVPKGYIKSAPSRTQDYMFRGTEPKPMSDFTSYTPNEFFPEGSFLEGLTIRKKQGGKLIKAEEGTKINWTSAISNIGQSLLSAYDQSKETKADAELLKAQNLQKFNEFYNNLVIQNKKDTDNVFQQWVQNYLSGLTLDRPSYIVAKHLGNQQLNYDLGQSRQQMNALNKIIDEQAKLQTSDAWGSAFSGILQTGLGLAGLYLASKNNPPSTATT